MNLHVIVFSKDRPLQLHGYLTSLFNRWYWPTGTSVQVDVLVRQNEPYQDAYDAVQEEFDGRVAVNWESDFSRNLQALLDYTKSDYTCFGCDDAVFVRPVSVGNVQDAFRACPYLLGYSLRLGLNIKRNYLAGEIPQPGFLGESPLRWDASAATSQSDWGYPWELTGTVYPTMYVRAMVASLTTVGQANTPNQLEHYGSLRWTVDTNCRLLACPQQSALVVPTVNRVQDEFANPLLGPELSPEFLLDCWNRGLRMDTQRFGTWTYDTIHVYDFFLRRAR